MTISLYLIFLLLISVIIVRQYRLNRIKSLNKKHGLNSRESIGEDVVAVLNSGKQEKRTIKESSWRKLLRSLGA